MSGEHAVEEFENDYIILNAAIDKRAFNLLCADDQVVTAPKSLLRKCAFFENMLNDEPDQQSFETGAPKEVVQALSQFLRGKVCYPGNAFDFVKLGVEIQFLAFIAACSLNAKTFSIPAQEPLNSAIRVCKAFVSCLPLRRIEHYAEILAEAKKKCQDPQSEYEAAILDELRKKRCKSFQLPLVPIFEKKLTLAVMQLIPDKITEMAAFIRGDWKPMDVLDGRIDLHGTQITGFHLIFGEYFIYATGTTKKVYIKDLVNDEPAEVFCGASKIFRSHFGYLFVVTTENGVDTVFIWSNAQKKFRKIFANAAMKIRNVSWTRSGVDREIRIRIITENNETLAIDQEGRYLYFKKHQISIRDCVNYFWLINNDSHYTNWRSNSSLLKVGDVTHIGYANISVEVVDANTGIYKTHSAEPKFKSRVLHGKVRAISDVYLGVDHVDLDLPCNTF